MVIDYNIPWHKLNIDVSNAVREDFNFKQYEKKLQNLNLPMGMWTFTYSQLTEVFNQSWLDYVKSTYDFEFSFLAIFYRTPFYNHFEAHTDTDSTGNMCIGAINWTLDPDDTSEMVWSEAPTPDKKMSTTPANSTYISADMDYFNRFKTYSHTLADKPTLVNVGMLHNVIMKDRPRWAISVKPKLPEVKNWKQLVDFFTPHMYAK